MVNEESMVAYLASRIISGKLLVREVLTKYPQFKDGIITALSSKGYGVTTDLNLVKVVNV